MSDNTFGYSNSGLTQSLNGITSITDGSGASITDGNAIFIDTNTNTATINNNLTIPLSSLITLYGNIYLPAYNITLTPSIMSGIGNLSGLTTRVSNLETNTFNISYDSPLNITTISGNSIFGTSGALATYTTMRINSDIILPSTVNIIQGSTTIQTTNIKNLPYLDATSSIQTQINNIKTILTGATYDTLSNYLNLANNLHIYGYLNLDNGITLQSPYMNISNQVLSYVDPTSSIQTQFNNITSSYSKLSNSNTFTNNQNIYKNIYIDDASFNDINYMQLSLSADGTNNGHNSVVGIDFTTWAGRTGGASTRIYAIDNSNYSAHLAFATASPGYLQTASTERMRIQDDGNIGIGTQTPAYLLDVNGRVNALTISENGTLLSSKYALSNYIPSQSNVSANATTGTFYLVFTSNSSGGTSNLNIGQLTYEATGKILKVNNIDAGASTNSTIYNSATTGTITIGGALTTGNIKLGLSTQTGTNQINGPTTFTGNVTFNNTISGTINNALKVKTNDITTGTYRIVLTDGDYPSFTNASLFTESIKLYYNASIYTLYSSIFNGNLDGVATTADNIKVVEDITSTSLYVPLVNTSINNPSIGVKVNNGLRYNTVTKALTTTTFIGNLTGNCTGSSGSCTGNSATATRASNVSLTTDNTSTALYIPLTSASATITSIGLKIDSGLSYNAATNTLTTGKITGSLDGVSSSTYSIYPSITTGVINIGSGLTTGLLSIGKAATTGLINILSSAINIGVSTGTTTINGLLNVINISTSNTTDITFGNSSGVGTINIYSLKIQLAGKLETRRGVGYQNYYPFEIQRFNSSALITNYYKYIICAFTTSGNITLPVPDTPFDGMEFVIRNIGTVFATVTTTPGNNVFQNLSNTLVSSLSGNVIRVVCYNNSTNTGSAWIQL